MHVLQKVYGSLAPAGPELAERLRLVLQKAQAAGFCPGADATDMVLLQEKTLVFSYEGLAFPLDDVLETLRGEPLSGKLDFLDLEAWTLTRHLWKNGGLSVRTGSLDAALEPKDHSYRFPLQKP